MANNIIILVGRILLAAMFIASGIGKFADPASTTGMITGAGLPAATLLTYLAAIFETVTGIAVILGFQTRIVSYLLAAFCVFTAFVFHRGIFPIAPPEELLPVATLTNAAALKGYFDFMGGMINQLMFFKNITIAGGFLILAAFGPGSISIDARRG